MSQSTLTFWRPALAGMLCMATGAGMMSIFGFFVEPLSTEFGVGAAVINIGPVALLLVPGIVSPFVGRLADRLPVRRLVLFGVALAMAALLVLSRAPSLALIGMCFLVFSLGLTFYGPVVINGLMVKLYPGQEARALSLVAVGMSLASAILPPLMGFLLMSFSWRTALSMLAIGVLVLLSAVAWRTLPGAVVGAINQADSRFDKRTYRRPEFWLIGVSMAMALSSSVIMALVYPPHFIARGYSQTQAGWFLTLAASAGLTGKLVVAWIADRVAAQAKWLAAGLLLIQTAGLYVLLVADSTPIVVLALCLLGFSMGAFIPMQPFVNSRYFDAAKISQVIGAQMPLFLPFGMVGAPLAGYAFDRTGNYDLVLMALMGVLAGAILLLLRLPVPQVQEQPDIQA